MIEKFNLIEEKQFLYVHRYVSHIPHMATKVVHAENNKSVLQRLFLPSIFFLKKPLNELFLFRCLFKT